ncbi:hypothetical protein AB1K70_15540 [Bremerella sp. JC770]|uniref:hypothetical protein n=1 Tax=Bremerella sp. JC770 TaxID=3232137 RepID=UPI0034599DAD
MSYRHPAHANVLYERAPYSSSREMAVGQHAVGIKSIARNRSDGSIDLLKGKGLSASIPFADQLKGCAKWLDVVQIELEFPVDYIEITEVRIFDHKTRTLIPKVDNRLGYQFVKPNVIQIFGVGKEVPQELDIWLRYAKFPDDQVYILQPQVGSKVNVPGGSVEIVEVNGRFSGYIAKQGFLPARPDSLFRGSFVLDWQAAWRGPVWIDVCAESVYGDRDYNSPPLRLPQDIQHAPPVQFRIPLENIAQLEIRNRGARERLFFDGCQVPDVSGRPFDSPPKIKIDYDGTHVEGQLKELLPIDVDYRIRPGNRIVTFEFGDPTAWVSPLDQFIELDATVSLYLRTGDHVPLAFDHRLQAVDTGKWSGLNPNEMPLAKRAGSYFPRAGKGGRSVKVLERRPNNLKAIEIVPRRM